MFLGAIHCIVYVWVWITMIMKRVKESLAALMKLKVCFDELTLTLPYDNFAFKHEPQIICYMS